MFYHIVCTSFKPAAKGGRLGFANLDLPGVGITIRGVVLNANSNRRWISWPAVETGRGYASCFAFMPQTDREAWQAAALSAIDAYTRTATEDNGPPLLMP